MCEVGLRSAEQAQRSIIGLFHEAATSDDEPDAGDDVRTHLNCCLIHVHEQKDLGFPETQVFPIPKDTILVLRFHMPGQVTVPCHNKGLLVKLLEPITHKDQELVKIVAKSRTADHTLKAFSITFDTDALGERCQLQCYCQWLVPLEEWNLFADSKSSFFGIPPPGNGSPFALWWGDHQGTEPEQVRWACFGIHADLSSPVTSMCGTTT